MRLFLAIDVDEATRVRVAAAVAAERTQLDAKWARTEGLHLTLVFLGETAEERVPSICETVAGVAPRHHRFTLQLSGAGTFGGQTTPRVLWLGLASTPPELLALQKELETSLGVKSEHDVYRPHLTLARSKTPRGDAALKGAAVRLSALDLTPWAVDHFTLYQSAGGHYRALGSWPLH